MLPGILFVFCAAANPILLDNGLIHLEVDPQLFCVRAAGFPGGPNFLDALQVEDRVRNGREWLDPGGLITDLTPFEAHNAAIRRGPAEIESQDAHSVVLLGRASEELGGIRLKKEIQIEEGQPRAHYRVSVLSESQTPQRLALRTTARLPLHTTVRVPREDGLITALAGLKNLSPVVAKSMKFWIIPIPPTSTANKTVLTSPTRRYTLENRSGTWTRTMVPPADLSPDDEDKGALLCVIDDETRSYGAALQTAAAPVTLGSPLVIAEEWEFAKRGALTQEKVKAPDKTKPETPHE